MENKPEQSEWLRSEERLRLLIDSITDYAIFVLDRGGNVLTWNAGGQRIQGYAHNEVIGTHFSRFYPAEDVQAGKPDAELKTAKEVGRMEDEGWRIRKDGSRFWANVVITALREPVTGNLIGFGKVTRDLTERKLAEERLRHSEEQFRLLVGEVAEYAIFMLDREGNILTWNEGARRAKGYDAEEVIGRNFSNFYTPDDQRAGRPAQLLRKAAAEGSARDQGVRVRKDGSRFHADVLITALHDSARGLVGFTKVTRDITDQIRVRDMEAARIAAEQANEAKSRFLAVLSHELRTPLTPVVSALDHLRENASTMSPEELAETIDLARRNARLEAQLIDDLLDITRIERGKIELHNEAVELHRTINDVVRMCQPEGAGNHVQVATNLSATAKWIWGDPTRIRQVIWNLVNNAVKFTPERGIVLVATRNPTASQIEVSVSDTGAGIAAENLARIFEPFEQGDRVLRRGRGGLGLGLAICKSLVSLHGGSISAESEGVGKGATFKVTLPAFAFCPVAPKAKAKADGPSAAMRILLVDDHADTARVLSALLRRRGHEVTVADSVASGTAAASEDFDVLVTDIGLRDGDGYDLFQAVRALRPGIRGIAISGFGAEEDQKRSLAAGFFAHLTKPVDAATIDAALSKTAKNDQKVPSGA